MNNNNFIIATERNAFWETEQMKLKPKTTIKLICEI